MSAIVGVPTLGGAFNWALEKASQRAVFVDESGHAAELMSLCSAHTCAPIVEPHALAAKMKLAIIDTTIITFATQLRTHSEIRSGPMCC